MDWLPYSVIMVETSGSASLTPRQACSVEAAARRSGLGVVVVMMSSRLDLSDNTTCYLINSDLNIQFYSVNFTSLGHNTSLGPTDSYITHSSSLSHYAETFLRTPNLVNNMVAPHKADVLRFKSNMYRVFLIKSSSTLTC